MRSLFIQRFFYLVKLGLENSLAAGSRMNILIGPVVQTWRVGFSDARVPTDEEIKAKLQLTDATKVELDDEHQTIFLLEEGMRIDLGCIAKGYIADLVIEQLKRAWSNLCAHKSWWECSYTRTSCSS